MSILTNYNKIVEGYKSKGIIKQDFKTVLKAVDMLYDSRLNENEKMIGLVTLFYTNNKTELPKILNKYGFEFCYNSIVDFIGLGYNKIKYGNDLSNCGRGDIGNNDKVECRGNLGDLDRVVFNYEFDADLIFSAFYQQYKIDLIDSDMHWFKFKALFDGLVDETKFMSIVGIRSMDIPKTDKHNKDYVKKLKELKDTYRINPLYYGGETLENKVDENGISLKYINDLNNISKSLKSLL